MVDPEVQADLLTLTTAVRHLLRSAITAQGGSMTLTPLTSLETDWQQVTILLHKLTTPVPPAAPPTP